MNNTPPTIFLNSVKAVNDYRLFSIPLLPKWQGNSIFRNIRFHITALARHRPLMCGTGKFPDQSHSFWPFALPVVRNLTSAIQQIIHQCDVMILGIVHRCHSLYCMINHVSAGIIINCNFTAVNHNC